MPGALDDPWRPECLPGTAPDSHSLFSGQTVYSGSATQSVSDAATSQTAVSRYDIDLEACTKEQGPDSAPHRPARVTRRESISGARRPEETFSHPLAIEKTSKHAIVDFEGPDDPYHPLNWPLRKKIVTTLLYGFTAMGATFASSVYSPGANDVAQEFGVGRETSLLGISLLLAGFGLGPLIWAPLSEVYGRRWTVLLPYFVAGLFTFGVAAARDIQTIMICRFFVGLFGASPVTNVGGVLADIWDPTQRGIATVAYAIAVTGGPTLGPLVGGAMQVSGLGWRGSQCLTGIYILVTFSVDTLVIDESYAPALLCHKASRLRLKTQNWSLHARHEEWDPSLKEMVKKFGARPFQMLFTPICFFMAVYASFVYGILYANLASFPIQFQQERGWNPLVGALPFLALLIGILIGAVMMVANQCTYNKRFRANGNQVVPEARLFPMMGGSFFFAVGLFVFGWASSRAVHWIVPVLGCVCIGVGFFTIFQSSISYLIDTFHIHAASAIAANTFLRSSSALAFPLIIDPMYAKLGIPWATSVFGFFGLLLIPIPFLFYKFGPAIRHKGRYSASKGAGLVH